LFNGIRDTVIFDETVDVKEAWLGRWLWLAVH
jgi:hypothetical protein